MPRQQLHEYEDDGRYVSYEIKALNGYTEKPWHIVRVYWSVTKDDFVEERISPFFTNKGNVRRYAELHNIPLNKELPVYGNKINETNNNMKNTIKLTESTLRKMVRESIRKALLKEDYFDHHDPDNYDPDAVANQIDTLYDDDMDNRVFAGMENEEEPYSEEDNLNRDIMAAEDMYDFNKDEDALRSLGLNESKLNRIIREVMEDTFDDSTIGSDVIDALNSPKNPKISQFRLGNVAALFQQAMTKCGVDDTTYVNVNKLVLQWITQ